MKLQTLMDDFIESGKVRERNYSAASWLHRERSATKGLRALLFADVPRPCCSYNATMDEEIPSHINEDGTLLVPSDALPAKLTLVSFRKDLLLMPSIMLQRFPKLERSRSVRLKHSWLKLTDDEINLLGTRRVLTIANGSFVHILPNSDRLREAKREASAALQRALNPDGVNAKLESRSASQEHLVVISYANQDRAYADLLAAYMRARSINAWHYVPNLRFGALFIDPLEQALRNASALAVLMSQHSLASRTVEKEVQIAMTKNLRILPILLSGRPLPILQRFVHFDATSGALPSEMVLREWLASP